MKETRDQSRELLYIRAKLHWNRAHDAVASGICPTSRGKHKKKKDRNRLEAGRLDGTVPVEYRSREHAKSGQQA